MTDKFNKDLIEIFDIAGKKMFSLNQKILTINLVCYGIFSSKSFNLYASKIVDIENLIKKVEPLLDLGEEIKSHQSVDIEKNLSHIIRECVAANASDENYKMNEIELLIEIVNKRTLPRDILDILNTNTLNQIIRSKNKIQKLKKCIRPTGDKSIKNEDLAQEKNSIERHLVNLSEKVLKLNSYNFERPQILSEMINVLLRKDKSNPILVGKPGVGKTTMVESLARCINEKEVPKQLHGKVIYELNLATLISGTNFRGDFEKRFENLIIFLKNNPNIILFIDEIHCLKGLGSSGSNSHELDLSNMLKPYLSSNEIRCIGSTTQEEYQLTISKDKALERRFKRINIEEPSIEETIKLISYKKKEYENFHNISIEDDVVTKIVNLTDRFIHTGNFPDKALDVLDISCSRARLHNEKILRTSNIIQTISSLTGIESAQIEGYNKKAIHIGQSLNSVIFGQEKAVQIIANNLIVSQAGLKNPMQPLGSFLLTGPTGVGKTELVNVLAKQLNMNYIRMDMSEYAEKGSASKMIGTTAGYVGFEEGGKLTNFILNNPYSIILLDEIEKADASIYNLFLQIMDYGKINSGSGIEVDFRNTLIFFTSNIGAENLFKNSIGLVSNNNEKVNESIEKFFTPEFRNRLTSIVNFSPLPKTVMEKLVFKKISELQERLVDRGITLDFSKNAINKIIEDGFSIKDGARPLEHYIEKNISFMIAKEILIEDLNSCVIKVDFDKEWKIEKGA